MGRAIAAAISPGPEGFRADPSMPSPLRHKLTGICPAARGAVVAELARTHPAPVWLVVTEEAEDAERLAEDIAVFSAAPPPEVRLFPEAKPDSRDMREAFAASSDRLAVLSRLRALGPAPDPPEPAPSLFIVTTAAALRQPMPAPEQLAAREVVLTAGQRQPFHGLLEVLRELDYDSEAVCEAPGHYAVRGGIIDVYPVTATQPNRLDFFGDEIEEIRALDPLTQRSGAPVAAITIAASPRLSLDPAQAGLADFLPPRTHLALIEPSALEDSPGADADRGAPGLGALASRCPELFGIGDLDEAAALLSGAGVVESTWDTESLVHHRRYPAESLLAPDRLEAETAARHDFLVQAAAWSRSGDTLVFIAAREAEEQRLREILDAAAEFKGVRPRFLRGGLNEGFKIRLAGKESRGGPPWSLSPRPKSSAGSGRGARRSRDAPWRRGRRSTSCWISPSWSKATSWSTSSTASPSTAGSRRSTWPRARRR